jgi:Lrp/AsnC family transcriptional regulator, leucine-responsive regulatory protein
MIDETDRLLIGLLQANARLSNAELAQSVGLTASSVYERVKKLEQKGVITGYSALVDASKLGKPLLAFMRVNFGATQSEGLKAAMDKIEALSAREPDILECHDVAGEDCLVLKLRASGPHDLQRLIAAIRDSTQSARSVTNIVLSTLKETAAVAPAVETEVAD